MKIPTFQEAVDELHRLGGRVVIDGDVATSVAAIRLHFNKRGWPIDENDTPELPSIYTRGRNVSEIEEDPEADDSVEDIGSVPAGPAAVRPSVVDAIMELDEAEIRRQLAERQTTIPDAVKDKADLASLLATAAGYTVGSVASEPSPEFNAIAAENSKALAEAMLPKPITIIGPVTGKKAADPPGDPPGDPPPAEPKPKGKK